MDKNQRINCSVNSCTFNNKQQQICQLEEIKIAPCPGCKNGRAEDESMCGSYEKSKHN